LVSGVKKQEAAMRKLCLFFIVAFFIITATTQAQQAEQAEVTNISGDVQVLLKDTQEYVPAQEGMILDSGDKIKTAAGASAELSFNEDNTNTVRLSEKTDAEMVFSGDEKLAVTDGEVFSSISKLPSGSAFEIRTPTAVSGARGTDWVTKVTEEGTDVEAVDSTPYVRHFDTSGALSSQITPIQAGQMTTVRKFQPPMPPRPMMGERIAKLQAVKTEVRRHSDEAVIKRAERAPFNRNQFLQEIKDGRGPSQQGKSPARQNQEQFSPEGVKQQGPAQQQNRPEVAQQQNRPAIIGQAPDRRLGGPEINRPEGVKQQGPAQQQNRPEVAQQQNRPAIIGQALDKRSSGGPAQTARPQANAPVKQKTGPDNRNALSDKRK
jgi:hypothetical protein